MLTHRQAEAFDFIFGFIEKHGRGPTFKEIAPALGIINPADLVNTLIRKGVLERDDKYQLCLPGPLLAPSARVLKPPSPGRWLKAVYDKKEEFQYLVPLKVTP